MNRREFARSLGAGAAAAHMASENPVTLGGRRELFVDGFLVDRFSGGARLRLHHPERREIVLRHDEPWEGSGSGYHTVFADGSRFRMYYKAWNHTFRKEATHNLVIAYAESRDGVHWRKPELGLVEFGGSKKNNIILDDVHGGMCHDFSPFLDRNPAARPEARYKAVGYGKPDGLYALQSPDGIHWKLISDAPILTEGKFDTQNIAFWDAARGRYRAYIRDFAGGRRDIKTATSGDFLRWSKLDWLRYPGAPGEQLYTNQVLPYYRAPHIFIGFPARYVDRGWTEWTRRLPEQAERETRAKASTRFGTAVTDTLLMTSRDGRSFNRWNEAFLRPGLRTRYNWSYGDNYLAWHVVETAPPSDDEPHELSLYATESYFTGTDARLRRYALRLDGFASAFAPLDGGELLTRPITFLGDRLWINFSTSAGGSLRVELQDADGAAVKGCEMADCVPIFGDAIEQPVVWRGVTSLRPWEGAPVRLRIELKDADLYAFRFGPPPQP